MVMAAAGSAAWAADDAFVPVEGMVLSLPDSAGEAPLLAMRRFNSELARFTGEAMPTVLGEAPEGRPVLRVGNKADLAHVFAAHGWAVAAEDADVRAQSYVLATEGAGGVVAAGFGEDDTARGYLGMSYALGDLIRRLDIRDGQWGFVLPEAPVLESPATPNRTLYHMNAFNAAPGLSLDYMTPSEIEGYVDFLVDARYSRVTFFQWREYYLYPGSAEERHAENQRVMRVMRNFLDYARRRGLETYQMITPSHIDVRRYFNDPKYVATTTTPDPFDDTGFFFYQSCCWSQPEARELARKIMRFQMELYGPLDGYTVWFWDPGGCFCADCRTHQAERIFDQLNTIATLAETASPGARVEACLWPTWAFPIYEEYGVPFNKEQSEALVRDFLQLALEKYGPHKLTLMDGGEDDFTHLFNGTLDGQPFPRDAFVYRVMGQQGESAFPFALFRIRYQQERLARVREKGIEGATFFTIYSTPNEPAVHAFADVRRHWPDRRPRRQGRRQGPLRGPVERPRGPRGSEAHRPQHEPRDGLRRHALFLPRRGPDAGREGRGSAVEPPGVLRRPGMAPGIPDRPAVLPRNGPRPGRGDLHGMV